MDLPLHFALMHLWARSRRRPNNTRTILGVRALVLTAATCAPHAAAAFAPQQAASDNPASVNYQNNRLQFRSSDGRFAANVQHRLQFRYAYPFDIDPRSPVDFDKASSSFFVRRARLKLDGHAFWPWLEWNLQYDWAQPVLRDLSFMVSKVSWFRVLLGQRKVCWNDERVTSSARQQFINRSIVNDIFTVDRQQGIQISGRVLPGSWYNDDAHMMYAGRLQWNVLGDALDFSQSDVEYHERPAASLAFGAAINTSGCTAYETDRESCRALTTTRSDGVQFASPQEAAGRYKLQQGFAEFRLKWRGLYAKHESHLKRVTDKAVADGAPGRTTVLRRSTSSFVTYGCASARCGPWRGSALRPKLVR